MKFPTLGGTTARHPAGSDLTAAGTRRPPCVLGDTNAGRLKLDTFRHGDSRIRSFGVREAHLVAQQLEIHHRDGDGDRRHHNRRRALRPDHELSREPWASLTLVDE